jgi:hypothetical protein
MSDPVAGENRARLGLAFKIVAYVAAAAATWLWMGLGSIPLIYMFPLGLVAVVDLHLANDGGWGVFFGTWAVYIVHGYFYFTSKTTVRALVLYAVLLILLIGNVAGCEKMIHQH